MNIIRLSYSVFIIIFCGSSAFSQGIRDSSIINSSYPKKFEDLISKGAVVDSGLFNIYIQEDKYYLEIENNILGKDILLVSRIIEGGADGRDVWNNLGYGGDAIGDCIVRFSFEQNRIYLKRISFTTFADSTQSLFQAVNRSNLQPIIAAFDIKASSKSTRGCIIDFTDFLNGENESFFISPSVKQALHIGGLQTDKSYIKKLFSNSGNLEIKSIKTFSRNFQTSIFENSNRATTLTLFLNTSLVLLPEIPMKPRFADDRVGYFKIDYLNYNSNPQGIARISMIKRWRLEPNINDLDKYYRGELVEPIKPIVFYIDPATPEKWVPYLIQGVNDWQVAFEAAGFKNAIYARLAPSKEEDSTWSLEDARYSAIVYKASSTPNANAPSIVDPRSGEILESHVNWYHNVMQILHDWYMIQASPNDARARRMIFDDELMGRLIRYACSHEIGHSLGLLHNFGASSTVPLDSLRSNSWINANGHSPSIMDYSRFNYVAQPQDSISQVNLIPKVNDYDLWAIEWGYRLFQKLNQPDEEKAFLNKWIIEKTKNKRLWFGSEINSNDPRSQPESLGDDAMKAGELGIRNLKYVLPNLIEWTKIPNENYSNLRRMYRVLQNQFDIYMGHVLKNIGGQYNNPKTVEENGVLYEVVPHEIQRRALDFINRELFATPKWLINMKILALVGMDAVDIISKLQEPYINGLLSASTFANLTSAEAESPKNAFPVLEFMSQLRKGIWAEIYTHKPIDVYRRNLQKKYIAALCRLADSKSASIGGVIQLPRGFSMTSPPNAYDFDASSISKAHLKDLREDIIVSVSLIKDQLTRYHLQDIVDRINECLAFKK
ncbi:MAG: zinc-dependent metalloprotease [Chitinophagaceae bacterium]|nr:zinc-dependent metalloprotease [Chitinophagaceae bacterium]